MTQTPSPLRGETHFDRVLAFTLPQSSARGRAVRMGPVLNEVLSSHDYPVPIRHLLGEALVLTALMGSLLKDEGNQITVQAQAEGGAVDLLVCDYRAGQVRGYVRHDETLLGEIGSNPNLEKLFGKGYLAITFDLQATADRYQGVVPLEGNSLAEACESYFVRSEQLQTLIRVGVRSSGTQTVAGGIMLQHYPDGEEGKGRLHLKESLAEWEHVSTLAASTRYDELIDSELSMEQLVWRLFHEEPEVRVDPLSPLARGCRCTIEHYRGILSRFPDDEIADMRAENGLIPVECAFCSKILEVDL